MENMAINKTLVVEAEDKSLLEINKELEEALDSAGASFSLVMKIELMVEEIFVNIAHYAYAPNKGKATIILSVSDSSPKELELVFIDEGKPYDPLKKETPDLTLDSKERGIGGLGIYLFKTIADSSSYERKDGKNILTVRKALI